ncbi:MAG: phosphoribosylglycinamide formyltransferase, partial [Clostridiales bacterium]|nr:phosphoribosylglycinamide formyltransferase [Clostridiales bacterium]
MKIAVFVSGGGTNLQAIIDNTKTGILQDIEIVLVLSSSPDAYALTRAADNGIKSVVL